MNHTVQSTQMNKAIIITHPVIYIYTCMASIIPLTKLLVLLGCTTRVQVYKGTVSTLIDK